MLGLKLFMGMMVGCAENDRAPEQQPSRLVGSLVGNQPQGVWDWCQSEFSSPDRFEYRKGEFVDKRFWKINDLVDYVTDKTKTNSKRSDAMACMAFQRTDLGLVNIKKKTKSYNSMTDALMKVAKTDTNQDLRKDAVKALNILLIPNHEGYRSKSVIQHYGASPSNTGRCEEVKAIAIELKVSVFRLCNEINYFPNSDRLNDGQEVEDTDVDAMASTEGRF